MGYWQNVSKRFGELNMRPTDRSMIEMSGDSNNSYNIAAGLIAAKNLIRAMWECR